MSVHLPHVRMEVSAQMVSMPTHVPVQPDMKEGTVRQVSSFVFAYMFISYTTVDQYVPSLAYL